MSHMQFAQTLTSPPNVTIFGVVCSLELVGLADTILRMTVRRLSRSQLGVTNFMCFVKLL